MGIFSITHLPQNNTTGIVDLGAIVYAIPPAPPGNISTITGEQIFTQSYMNAYNTAFNQQTSSYTKLSKGFVSIC